MSGEEADIAVIGAGPSGLISAREASLRGAKVVVLEEHGEIGLPCHCAGLLSIKGLREINVPVDGPYVLNRVRGAYFFSPSNLSFSIEGREHIACVVNRHVFDLFLAEQASKSGAIIRLNSRVRKVKRLGDYWILDSGGEVAAKILIDAEGAASRILQTIGLETLNISSLLSGLQVDLEGVSLNPDYVEVHFSNRLAPGLFAWVIPLSEESARVGLACKGSDVRERLFKFIKKRFGERFDNKMRGLRFYSGLVITQGPIKKTYGDALLVVGDSAGQVKPISGGGVVFGGKCASIAGEVVSRAIGENDASENFLKTYEVKWRGEIGRELRTALFIRNILNKLSDRDLDKIFSIVIEEEIYRDVSEKGEMDFHGNLIVKAVRGRRLLRLLPMLIKAMITLH
ncbi:MAG: NAD(P)/FAD-dependent oxidoreductase [Candidatus Bathyarchaeota archaeon]|nr:NAD(P)/FAD-dependent oxidoreductase [Candidatus Bathyarchaeota archaeon]